MRGCGVARTAGERAAAVLRSFNAAPVPRPALLAAPLRHACGALCGVGRLTRSYSCCSVVSSPARWCPAQCCGAAPAAQRCAPSRCGRVRGAPRRMTTHTEAVSTEEGGGQGDGVGPPPALKGRERESRRLAELRKGLRVLARAMVDFNATVEGWSLEDSTLALAVLAKLRDVPPDEAPPNRRGREECTAPVHDSAQLRELREWLTLAHAAYSANEDELSRRSGLPQGAFRHTRFREGVLEPAYYVAVDDVRQAIIVCVRGTWSIADMLINFVVSPEPHLDGLGHRGMVQAARNLLALLEGRILELKREHPHHELVFVGHSMGGAAAVLMAMQLREAVPDVRAVTFSTPACVSLSLARECAPYVTSVIHGDDFVPRLHVANMERLRTELAGVDWLAALRDLTVTEVRKSRIVEGARQAGAAVSAGLSSAALQRVAAALLSQAQERLRLLRVLDRLQSALSANAKASALTQHEHAVETLQRREMAAVRSKLAALDTDLKRGLAAASRAVDIEQLTEQARRRLTKVLELIVELQKATTSAWRSLHPGKKLTDGSVLRYLRAAREALRHGRATSARERADQPAQQSRSAANQPRVDDDGPHSPLAAALAPMARLQYYIPGTVFHVVREYGVVWPPEAEATNAGSIGEFAADGSSAVDTTGDRPPAVVLLSDDCTHLDSFVLSPTLFTDHLCSSLEVALDDAIASLERGEPLG